jgi:hypothetical protein
VAISLAAVCSLFGQVRADESVVEPAIEPSHFYVSGFGTLGYAYNDNKVLGFVRDRSENGRRPWLIDSRLGLQLAFQATSQLEFLTQFVARDQGLNSPARSVEWAFVGYRPNADWQLRLGRLGIDEYLMSDTRNVGYASPMVRPPVEFYGAFAASAFNGADAAYSLRINDVNVQTKVQFGSGIFNYGGSVPLDWKLNDYLSLSLNAEQGAWRTRLGYSQARSGTELPFESLRTALDQVAATATPFFPDIAADAVQLRQALIYKGPTLHRVAAATAYDDGLWVAQGELSRSWCACQKASFYEYASGYVFAGRRFGTLLPFVMASGIQNKKTVIRVEANWSVLGPSTVQVQTLAVLNANVTGARDQRTFSVGARWDFNKSAAAKLQWDQTHVDGDAEALWIKPSLTGPNQRVNIFSIVVDFFF